MTNGPRRAAALAAVLLAAGCSNSGNQNDQDGKALVATAETCMSCHNGAPHDDYGGPGLENPHPFAGAGTLSCTTCHGGNPRGQGPDSAHVPPPPEIGDEKNQIQNAHAYFNRLTLAGIDKFGDYQVKGTTYSALDYLQFVNPGDLRVTTQGRGCGACHAPHSDCVASSPLATEMGILSGAMYAIGVDNQVPASQGLYEDTAADLAFRVVTDPAFTGTQMGTVSQLLEFPVFSVFGASGANDIFNNQLYNSIDLPTSQLADGRVITDSPLANLYHEQIAFTCGDCHLGSAGANNRYGDFRSSGCTACHMRYSLDGRSHSKDPNIKKKEPRDPDDIDPPERAHVQRHRIVSVARTLTTGEFSPGIDDYTCAGCHQGSNRTVMQYWGIRLDQNADVHHRNQYPADPVSFETTREDTRLFDPVVENHTFNGRNHTQYLLYEDYDGDGRDDTPADVHYEAGMGCIDCHGSHDVHGGTVGHPSGTQIVSRQEQAVAIRCEDCHGTVDAYAATTAGMTYSGAAATLAVDSLGNPLRHVVLESDGNFYLYSRLTGARHFVPQILDVVVDSGKLDPLDQKPLYNVKASYAMGRADGDPGTGMGPSQVGGVTPGFSHMDNMSCASCHASWTNSCIGCHLGGEYDTGNNFSNITGDRIVFRQANADFVYQSPVFFQLGVDTHNRIAPISPNTEVFFQYEDLNNTDSKVFSFSDRNARGNNTGATAMPALSHNVLMPHSIRGRVSKSNEGPRYCVSCHLTEDALLDFGTEYDAFRLAISSGNYAGLDYNLLRTHIGQNTGNQLNSPFWIHMAAGLGSGLFLFDQHGCPVNPLDDFAGRIGCNNVEPRLNPNAPVLDLDRIVDETGASAGSNNHPMLVPPVPLLRDGAANPDQSGPLGATLIQRLSDPILGIVLDSWINANGNSQGQAKTFLGQ